MEVWIEDVGRTEAEDGGVEGVGRTEAEDGGVEDVAMTEAEDGGVEDVGMTEAEDGGVEDVGMTEAEDGGVEGVGRTEAAVTEGCGRRQRVMKLHEETEAALMESSRRGKEMDKMVDSLKASREEAEKDIRDHVALLHSFLDQHHRRQQEVLRQRYKDFLHQILVNKTEWLNYEARLAGLLKEVTEKIEHVTEDYEVTAVSTDDVTALSNQLASCKARAPTLEMPELTYVLEVPEATADDLQRLVGRFVFTENKNCPPPSQQGAASSADDATTSSRPSGPTTTTSATTTNSSSSAKPSASSTAPRPSAGSTTPKASDNSTTPKASASSTTPKASDNSTIPKASASSTTPNASASSTTPNTSASTTLKPPDSGTTSLSPSASGNLSGSKAANKNPKSSTPPDPKKQASGKSAPGPAAQSANKKKKRKKKNKKKRVLQQKSFAQTLSKPTAIVASVELPPIAVWPDGEKPAPTGIAPKTDSTAWLVYWHNSPNLDLVHEEGDVLQSTRIGGNAVHVDVLETGEVVVASVSPRNLRIFNQDGTNERVLSELSFTCTGVAVGSTGIAFSGSKAIFWIALTGGDSAVVLVKSSDLHVCSLAVATLQGKELVCAADKGAKAVHFYEKTTTPRGEFAPLPPFRLAASWGVEAAAAFTPVSVSAHRSGFLAVLDAASRSVFVVDVVKNLVVSVIDGEWVCGGGPGGVPAVLAFVPMDEEEEPELWVVSTAGRVCMACLDFLYG